MSLHFNGINALGYLAEPTLGMVFFWKNLYYYRRSWSTGTTIYVLRLISYQQGMKKTQHKKVLTLYSQYVFTYKNVAPKDTWWDEFVYLLSLWGPQSYEMHYVDWTYEMPEPALNKTDFHAPRNYDFSFFRHKWVNFIQKILITSESSGVWANTFTPIRWRGSSVCKMKKGEVTLWMNIPQKLEIIQFDRPGETCPFRMKGKFFKLSDKPMLALFWDLQVTLKTTESISLDIIKSV